MPNYKDAVPDNTIGEAELIARPKKRPELPA